jgi:crossover junction endodeoxyribonuclease RuvC
MKIIGIDPGTARVGWAIITAAESKIHPLVYGCMTTKTHISPQDRLLTIHKGITDLLSTHKPDHLALEALFFANNAKTVIPVGQSRGVILLAAAQQGIPVYSYSPKTVKNTITGDGNAGKEQITSMVMRILALDTPPKPDDTADAIAIALTHAYSYKLKEKIK